MTRRRCRGRTPAPRSGPLWEPIPLGVDEHGEPVQVGLVERNVLVGGEPGAGKSVALSLLVAAAALDPSARVAA
jgi:predicted ATP-dependent serine protease